MLKRLLKFFRGPTPEEAYQNGRRMARDFIAESADKSAGADHLYYMSDGALNGSFAEREFDRGVEDQLHEMGYQAPYQNGQF